jgi:hypothetical protein
MSPAALSGSAARPGSAVRPGSAPRTMGGGGREGRTRDGARDAMPGGGIRAVGSVQLGEEARRNASGGGKVATDLTFARPSCTWQHPGWRRCRWDGGNCGRRRRGR